MKYFIITALFTAMLFGITPFSVEKVKNINVKVVDKTKLLPAELKSKITKEIKSALANAGIVTQSDEFSNFIVKIEGIQVEKKHVVNISMFIIEDVFPLRDRENEAIAITYQKNDFFDTSDLQTDVYESVIDYLLFDFLEQYREENQ